MSPTRAVLCGYYGMGNAGDEALLVSLLQMLPSSVTPIVLSGNPRATKKQYGVASCDRKSAFAVLNALNQSQVFIWGGGSLMQDSTSIASPIYYAGLMSLAQQRGLTTIAWAQGIGPLNKSGTRWLTKQVLLGCNAISVRDTASAELLQSWQIESIVAPDPVWAMESKTLPELDDISKPKVAVVLRSHPLLSKNRLQTLTKAIKDFQAQTDSHILLIPFQPTQDRAIAKSISTALGHHNSILSINDPKELKGLFQQVKMAIGMRLHSLILAAAEGCNCFALSYDPKVSRLMSEVNLPGYELANLPDDPSLISQAWIELFHAPTKLSAVQIQSLVDRASIHQQLLRKAIPNC
ncbi:polysaccharide pyruvyl transferase CsaB [Waterburya agarophytonicola K14]|uniref:Polysaccharide pyruvyl transferase CsaB n=1 Tax=Waterburya agarophytonicola KI4 TaxID=2874699 RepID=A0A964BWA8_9CYAN|nr:polysaccharide pyruvyl transferase CsaB [Waterburya agarophytonicola]MCC0178982.1 polysaccharide pyruvyl transferase CsaB [Waterburya agarophytonicola KI4]